MLSFGSSNAAGSSDAAEDGDAKPTSTHEAGDEQEDFSGLREIGRPFAFRDDGPSADRSSAAPTDSAELDVPEENTVLLAPRRDFSPTGMARDEGAGADIESPFAAPSSKTASSELMSPVRRPAGDLGRSEQVFEAKARLSDCDPVREMPAQRRRPPPSIPPQSSPVAEHPAHRRPANQPPTKPPLQTSSEVLPLDDPSQTRPRPVSPARAVAGFASERPSLRRRPPVGNGNDGLLSIGAPSSAPVPAETPPPLTPSAARPSSRDDDAVATWRQTGVDQPKEATAPEGPPAPSRLRLALGAFSRGARALLRGLGSAWAVYFQFCLMLQRGLELAWAGYSKGCLALQIRLSRSAGWAWAKGRSLAAYSGAALVRLGLLGAVLTWKLLKVTARHALVLAKTGLSVTSRGGAQAGAYVSTHVSTHVAAAIRRMLAMAVEAFDGVGKIWERWIAARADKRAKATEAANAARAAEVIEAAEALKAQVRLSSTPPKEASRPLPASKALEPSSSMARPATSSSSPLTPPKAKRTALTPTSETATPTSVDASLSGQRSRLISWPGRPRFALTGLAAASIACLIAAFTFSPTTGLASKASVFLIPAKPVIGVIPPKGLENLADGSAAPKTLKLEDPIAEIIAYVDARALDAPVEPSVSPVLARAGTEEGLSQFIRAAEVVGLGKLLEPGEAYTIFAPTDEAFARLASGEVASLLDPTGHERLLRLLSHHVLPGRLDVGDLQGDVRDHVSLAGEPLRIDATAVINVGGAGMVDADLQAENGVLHVIDQVLLITVP